MGLTGRLDDNLTPFLQDHGFQVVPFGHPVILRDNTEMRSLIRRLEYKKSNEVLMVKFSPDFIVLPPDSRKEPFFMDTKAGITPVFFDTQIRRIREAAHLPNLKREDIFEIEREAWDTYKNIYPAGAVAVFAACPYHPRLLLGEWVSSIQPLFRFQDDRNLEAAGSGTPHVNIHMGRMRTLKEFLEQEFGIAVDEDAYESILDFIKQWPLNKPAGRVNWTQFNNVIVDLQQTCPWLETRNEPEGWRPRQQPRLL